MAKRVVVADMGLVTLPGLGVEVAWHRLSLGPSGLRRRPGTLVVDIPAKADGLGSSIDEDPAQHSDEVAKDNHDGIFAGANSDAEASSRS